MRQFINKFGIHIVIAGAIVAAVVLWFHFRTPARPRNAEDFNLAFFVDEDTGDESVLPNSEIPPLAGKDGKPTLVKAIKYTCDDGKTSQVLYYFKYTDAVQAELKALPPNDAVADLRRAQLISQGQLVRAPAPNSPWLPLNTVEGAQLMAFPECPNGGHARICYPHK